MNVQANDKWLLAEAARQLEAGESALVVDGDQVGVLNSGELKHLERSGAFQWLFEGEPSAEDLRDRFVVLLWDGRTSAALHNHAGSLLELGAPGLRDVADYLEAQARQMATQVGAQQSLMVGLGHASNLVAVMARQLEAMQPPLKGAERCRAIFENGPGYVWVFGGIWAPLTAEGKMKIIRPTDWVALDLVELSSPPQVVRYWVSIEKMDDFNQRIWGTVVEAEEQPPPHRARPTEPSLVGVQLCFEHRQVMNVRRFDPEGKEKVIETLRGLHRDMPFFFQVQTWASVTSLELNMDIVEIVEANHEAQCHVLVKEQINSETWSGKVVKHSPSAPLDATILFGLQHVRSVRSVQKLPF